MAKALGLPPSNLATDKLPVSYVAPEKLVRVSGYTSGEPFFGQSGANRFDAPGCAAGTPEFSSCYLGFSLSVAIAESILHDEIPVNGKFRIAETTLTSKHVLRFQGANLRLLLLAGVNLKRLDGNADLSGTSDYTVSQQWSLAVHRNPANYDGFIYMSRHLNTEKAVILFDRARSKIAMASSTVLVATPGFATAAKAFGIVGV
ncbi:MAG: RES family NAD+ phosphorylase [Pseudomonadota bacterium]